MTKTYKPEIEFRGDIKHLQKKINQLNTKLDEFGRNGKRQGDKVNKSFTGLKIGMLALATASVLAFKKAIGVAKEFQQSMANLRAIARPTREEFRALEKDALELGRTTKFTASQVAGLQTEYAKLGFSADEILKVTKGTLALATATGADLAESASVAGATLRGFGLDASQTGRVTAIMAESFSKSALDMQKFSDSMKFAGPVAKMAGFEIEGTTALLGQLANAGIDGSLAGTALRSIFLKLADSGSALSKKMGTGIDSIEELIPAMLKLKEEGIGASEMLELVDKRSVSAFSVIVDGAEDVMKLKEAFDNASGSAQKMADEQMDTLEGDMLSLTSATEGLAIAFVDNFMGAIRATVQGFTNLISTITGFMEIPLETKLHQEQVELNALFDILQDVNIGQDTRNTAIDTLQDVYGDYIENIDLEKTSLDELAIAQQTANEKFEDMIRIRVAEAVLEDQRIAIAKLKVDIVEYEVEMKQLSAIMDDHVVGGEILITTYGILHGKNERAKMDLEKAIELYEAKNKFLLENGYLLNDSAEKTGKVTTASAELLDVLNDPIPKDPFGFEDSGEDIDNYLEKLKPLADPDLFGDQIQMLGYVSDAFRNIFDPEKTGGEKLKGVLLSALSAFERVIMASKAVSLAVNSIFKGPLGIGHIIGALALLQVAKAGVKAVKFGEGGIINQPVFSPLMGGAIAGERGREAIIPLDRSGGIFEVMTNELRGLRKDIKKMKGVQIDSNIDGIEFVESHIEPSENEIGARRWP